MRFLSPSFLSFSLLMALLPWVEIRCEQRTAAPFRLSYPIVEQNAFQIAIGDARLDLPQQPGRFNPGQVPPGDMQEKVKEKVSAAPLLGVHVGCILIGAIIGFAVPARKPRLILMTAVTLGAVATLLAQVLIGFPLLKYDHPAILNVFDQFKQADPNFGRMEPQLRDPGIFFTKGFTLWFYLALLTTSASLVGVLVDFLNPPKKRSSRRDDDDYDDEAPPPRRRRRRYDDDDYDDDYR
jgi:hypothetical protein